jgi:uncharacterized protein YggE
MLNRVVRGIGILGISAVVLVTVVGLASRTDTASASTPQQAEPPVKREITVSGTGRVTAEPDLATIHIGVQITAPTLAEATKQANDAMTGVLAAIKAQGIEDKEIQTSSYTVNPITNYKEGTTPEVTGYQVSNFVTVKVKNIANVGKVLDAGMGAGANYLGGVFFGIADPTRFETDARTAAVKDAASIAQTLASAAGVRLGRVISISEGSLVIPPPIPFGRGAADTANAGPVETGSLEISTNVTVRYEISE